jgi:RND family efflux transporter MFP subunit
MKRGRALLYVACVAGLALPSGACKPKGAEDAAAGAEEEAMPVDVVALEPKPVRDTSEHLATLASRTSVALYPQVVGHVSKILVKPGARVKAGAELVQIDPTQQQATLDQLAAAVKLREANLRFAQVRAERASTLIDSGLMSRQDHDQAVSEKEAAEAELKAAAAQRQVQASQLRFFKITAPFDGVVGDVPVKLGELVTATTLVTTVNQNAVIEAYIDVPVERSADLTPDSSVQLLDARGGVIGESRVSFVADQAKAETQSVLIKAAFPNATSLKVAQLVRARVVWSTRPGLLLPTTAVMRQSGQTFAFVVEPVEGGFVARQRAVKLGAIEGNEYVVAEGLRQGERVIASGLQKVRDSAKVAPKG